VVFFVCPYLGGPVELTRERERHILRKHPEVMADQSDRLALALSDPDEVHRDPDDAGIRLFFRWIHNWLGGKNLVVVVVSGSGPTARHWVVTAFPSRKLPAGEPEWKRG